MYQTKRLHFPELPHDDNLWKIDWLAEPLLSLAIESTPTIKLYFSKVRNPEHIDTLDPNIPTNYCQIRMAVGHLSLFNIGSIWKNGIKKADSLDPTLFVSQVNTATAHVVTFDQVIHNSLTPIFSKLNYSIGKQAYSRLEKSPLIALPYNNDPKGLLIPAIEVIRFYYLISSKLSFSTFFGDIQNLTTDTPIFNREAKTVSMSMKWGLTHNDAWVLGRYWSSEIMRSRAVEIRAWIVQNCTNYKDNISSSTFFPFDGHTELTFNGIKVSCADGVTRYLCTKIRQCSGPINYEKIVLNKVRKVHGDDGSDESGSIINSNWPLYETENSNDIESQEKASGENLPKDYFEEEVRFTALKLKSLVVHTTDDFGEGKSSKYMGTGGRETLLTSGEAGSGKKDLRQATVSSNLKKEVSEFSEGPERFRAFLRILTELRDEGLEVETLGLYAPVGFKLPVNTYSVASETVIGCFGTTKNTWITRRGGGIPRGLFIVEVKFNEKYWYLLELEKFESEVNDTYSLMILYFPDNRKIYNKSLYEYVSACCEYQGWKPLKDNFSKFEKYNLAHTLNLKNRILKIVRS